MDSWIQGNQAVTRNMQSLLDGWASRQHVILYWECQFDIPIGRGTWSSCSSILTRALETTFPRAWVREWFVFHMSLKTGMRGEGSSSDCYLNANGRLMCLFRLQMNESDRTKRSQIGGVRRGDLEVTADNKQRQYKLDKYDHSVAQTSTSTSILQRHRTHVLNLQDNVFLQQSKTDNTKIWKGLSSVM